MSEYEIIIKASTGSVTIPSEGWDAKLFISLDAHRRKKTFSLMKSYRRSSDIIGEIRRGSTVFGSYSPAGPLSTRKLSRYEMICGKEYTGQPGKRQTVELLEAVNSLLEQINQEFEALSVEYGVSVPLWKQHLRIPGGYEDPSVYKGHGPLRIWWCSFFAGLKFPDDPHPYTLWANFGVLDLIKHDPITGDEIERKDIRSCNVLHPINTAEIRIFRLTHDLKPLRDGLVKLRELLQITPDETVTIVTERVKGYQEPEIVPDEFWTPPTKI
jgi:hypothetical protein